MYYFILGFVNICYCILVNIFFIFMIFSLRVLVDGWVNDEFYSYDSLIDSNISDVGSFGIFFFREFDIVLFFGIIVF